MIWRIQMVTLFLVVGKRYIAKIYMSCLSIIWNWTKLNNSFSGLSLMDTVALYLLLYYCFLFFSTRNYGKTHNMICGMIYLRQITKSILLALSINLSLFTFKWISACSINVSSALYVPPTVRFSDIFWMRSNWCFVYWSLLHIIHFLSAWLDLFCKLCLYFCVRLKIDA